ncbi:sigma factor [Sinomonas sp.]|uniref:sigma factor n=1 Tax=Sinomonas sp. TaxID=1914986 RepID=UPI003F7FC4FF
MMADDVRAAIARAHRDEWARVVAALARRFRDLDLAEEAAAEAFAAAVEHWTHGGVPPRPGAWLTTTASHKAIDRIRRENKREQKHEEARMLYEDDAIARRITRAKAKITAARIPYRIPSEEDLPARLPGVLAVFFLIFTEGYLATGPGARTPCVRT